MGRHLLRIARTAFGLICTATFVAILSALYGAFIILAVSGAASTGNFTPAYLIFVGVDIVGMILLLLVTNKCKGTP